MPFCYAPNKLIITMNSSGGKKKKKKRPQIQQVKLISTIAFFYIKIYILNIFM